MGALENRSAGLDTLTYRFFFRVDPCVPWLDECPRPGRSFNHGKHGMTRKRAHAEEIRGS